jgi:hypothetical protein
METIRELISKTEIIIMFTKATFLLILYLNLKNLKALKRNKKKESINNPAT